MPSSFQSKSKSNMITQLVTLPSHATCHIPSVIHHETLLIFWRFLGTWFLLRNPGRSSSTRSRYASILVRRFGWWFLRCPDRSRRTGTVTSTGTIIGTGTSTGNLFFFDRSWGFFFFFFDRSWGCCVVCGILGHNTLASVRIFLDRHRLGNGLCTGEADDNEESSYSNLSSDVWCDDEFQIIILWCFSLVGFIFKLK